MVIIMIDEKYILSNFENALQNKLIKAYYQPIIRTLSGKVCCAEALARWIDPKEGVLSPFYFVNVLEKHKLIHKLDLMVLENICETYNKMKERGIEPVPFSLNLSRLDFNEADMLHEITCILRRYNVPNEAIHLEITESVMLDNTIYFRNIFDAFHEAGFDIYMDDFGSGYSSLNVLKDYHFDVLKIDMRFLSDTGTRSKNILASIINMAKVIGIHTLTEGVETEDQMRFLSSIGCEMLQGYYYSKPMNDDDFIEYILAEADKVEQPDESRYFNTVGKLNYLSTNPFGEADLSASGDDGGEPCSYINESPLALIEYDGTDVLFKYTNDAYVRELSKQGFNSTEDIENAVNKDERIFHKRFFEFIESAVKDDSIHTIDNVINGRHFTFKTKRIAQYQGRTMAVATLNVYDPGHTDDRSTDLQKYCEMLYSTYDFVMMLYPATNTTHIIYSSIGTDEDVADPVLDIGLLDYANNFVYEADRERYLHFLNIDTFEARMNELEVPFIQAPFRIKWINDTYRWVNVRLTRVHSNSEPKYILTMQSLDKREASFKEQHFEK